MKLNKVKNLDVARKCFKKWSSEQDTTAPIYPLHAEEFFARHLYGDLVDFQNYPSQEIGEYVKAFMQYVEHELQRIHDEEEQRALDRRKVLGL